jgi:cobalamin biosynthetic protein CobC
MSTTWTFHGGRLDEARKAFGNNGEPWLDLSTGINPHAWPHADETAIDWQNLPDESALRMLEQAAANYFGVDPAYVSALPGTEIGLRLLSKVLPGPARHVWPSYRTHGEMFADSAPLPASGLEQAAGGITLLANPNNPDGRTSAPDELLAHLGRIRAATGWLVVDEAFADTDPAASLAAQVSEEAPLVIFRSFGKFFGLAGLRLGFVLGPPALIVDFRAQLGAWPVSAAAIAIGTAAYRDAPWIAATRGQLNQDAAALDAMLRASGYNPTGTCPLFRLIETDDAAALFERLARRAILSRPFDYDPRWLRLGLPGSEAALARLTRALADG